MYYPFFSKKRKSSPRKIIIRESRIVTWPRIKDSCLVSLYPRRFNITRIESGLVGGMENAVGRWIGGGNPGYGAAMMHRPTNQRAASSRSGVMAAGHRPM